MRRVPDRRRYRDWLKLWTQVALVLLILFTLSSFFSDKVRHASHTSLPAAGKHTNTGAVLC